MSKVIPAQQICHCFLSFVSRVLFAKKVIKLCLCKNIPKQWNWTKFASEMVCFGQNINHCFNLFQIISYYSIFHPKCPKLICFLKVAEFRLVIRLCNHSQKVLSIIQILFLSKTTFFCLSLWLYFWYFHPLFWINLITGVKSFLFWWKMTCT